jgi:hypothetical protein
MTLTQKTVNAAAYEGHSRESKDGRKRWTQHILWDDKLPGLGLRITSTNRKSFIVTYRDDGRKRTKTLGSAAKLKLGAARRQAAEFLDTVSQAQPRTAQRPPIEGIETVAQLADAYLEQHLKGSTPSWFADQRLMQTHIKPTMGRSLVAEVTLTDLANLRTRVARRFPADIRRLKPLVSGMFDWAAERGLWSKSSGARRATQAPPAAGPKAQTQRQTRRKTRRKAQPLPPPEELAESLRRSEEERRKLAVRLEEVSLSGAEMLAQLNQQATDQKEIESELARSQRQLDRAKTTAKSLPDPKKTEKQMANLRQSVDQLLASLKETETARDELADELAIAEARSGEQAKKMALLSRSRDELEERMREQERQGAIHKARRHDGAGRSRIAAWLTAGTIVGVLLTLLLQRALGPSDFSMTQAAIREPVAAETVTEQPPAPGFATDGVPEGSGEPVTPAVSEAPTSPDSDEAVPDVTLAEAAVRSWAEAWSAQRVDDYLAAYSAEFAPVGGPGRAEWMAQRRDRILRPGSIRVTLGPLSQATAGADRVRVTFEQSYETPTYADKVLKTLELAWEEEGWKIVAEVAN